MPATSRACFRFCKYGNNPDALRRFVLIFKDSSGDFYIYFARSCPLFSGGSLLYYGDNIPAIIFFDLLCLWSSVCFGDTTRPFRCLLIGFRFDFFVCLSFSLSILYTHFIPFAILLLHKIYTNCDILLL